MTDHTRYGDEGRVAWQKRVEREKHDERLRRGARVQTEDGEGEIIGMNMRRNTNGGPGVRQYVVRLDDGRVRHYATGCLESK